MVELQSSCSKIVEKKSENMTAIQEGKKTLRQKNNMDEMSEQEEENNDTERQTTKVNRRWMKIETQKECQNLVYLRGLSKQNLLTVILARMFIYGYWESLLMTLFFRAIFMRVREIKN